MDAIKNKYRAIDDQERSWAFAVVRTWIKPRPISVWEVLIPVLLVFLYAKSRTDREVLVQNLLFTKEQALQAALEIVRSGADPEEALAPTLQKTQDLLSTAGESVYSEGIRQAQLEEIRLLRDHYVRLLRAGGDDFDTLVRSTYQTRASYDDFLGRLREAEHAVNQAALETLGPRGDAERVSVMEAAYDRARAATAERIFASGAGSAC